MECHRPSEIVKVNTEGDEVRGVVLGLAHQAERRGWIWKKLRNSREERNVPRSNTFMSAFVRSIRAFVCIR